MKTEMLGFSFNKIGTTLIADDAVFTILNADGEEQSFSFGTVELKRYAEFFSKYFCAALLIKSNTGPGILDLDDVKHDERVTKLTLSIVHPIQLAFSSKKIYFPNLRWLWFEGKCPDTFPDLSKMPHLETLTIEYDKNFLEHWVNLKQLKDLCISDYDELDFSSLRGLTNLRRLKVFGGKVKSLDGLELLPNLETVHISAASKLLDVDAVLKSKSIKNIMFEKYKKITNWEFLKNKKDFRSIALDTAESIDFMKDFPDLDFFFCKTVKDRNNKSFLYSTKLFQETMIRDGIQVSYIVPGDAFYQPLDSQNEAQP
jgi:hypothetical protein